jgi:hypothetical protein
MPGDSAFTPRKLTRVILLGNAIRFTLISAPMAHKPVFMHGPGAAIWRDGNPNNFALS